MKHAVSMSWCRSCKTVHLSVKQHVVMMHDRYACIDIPLAFQLSHLELPSGD